MAGFGDPVVSVAMADFDLMELAPDQVRLHFHFPLPLSSSSSFLVPLLHLCQNGHWELSLPESFDSFGLLFLLSQVEMKGGGGSE